MNLYAITINLDGTSTDAGDYRRSVSALDFTSVTFHGRMGDEFTPCAAGVCRTVNGGFEVLMQDGIGTENSHIAARETFCSLTTALRVAHGWCIAD